MGKYFNDYGSTFMVSFINDATGEPDRTFTVKAGLDENSIDAWARIRHQQLDHLIDGQTLLIQRLDDVLKKDATPA